MTQKQKTHEEKVDYSNLILFIGDLIIALEHKRHSMAVFTELVQYDTIPNPEIKSRAAQENFILTAIDKPLNSEVVSKIYGLLYSDDEERLSNPKFKFKENTKVRTNIAALKKTFPQKLMYNLRNRFVSHLDPAHASKEDSIPADELERAFSEIFRIQNIENIMQLLKNIYGEISQKDDLRDLALGLAGTRGYWKRYAAGSSIESGLDMNKCFMILQG